MDDKEIRRIAARSYDGWLWHDGQLLSEYVERVAGGVEAITDSGETEIRWAAWLSAVPTVGVRVADLLRRGVPPGVVDIVETLRQRPWEVPIGYARRISTRRAPTVIRFVEWTELAEAEPLRYRHWRAAHRLLGEKLSLPVREATPARVPVPAGPAEHWHRFAEQAEAQPDPYVFDTLLTGYRTELRPCCRNAIRGALYAAGRAPYAAELAESWWDSQDPWEAMMATRVSDDVARLRGRLADERPNVVHAAITGLPPEQSNAAEIAALGRIVRRAEPHWRWCRTAAARRLRVIGGPVAVQALRDRPLSPLDPPWREDPQWLARYGASRIPDLLDVVDKPEWWYEAPYALGKLRATDAVPAICLRLRAHPNWIPGIDALGRIGSARAIEVLTDTAVAGPAEARDHSLRALARLSPTAAVRAAIVASDDIDPIVRDRAARLLVRHGDECAVSVLLRLCDTGFAAKAARALGRVDDPRAAPTLWKLFSTGAPRVRSAAGRALADLSGALQFPSHLMRDVDSGRRRALLRLYGYRREWVKPRFIEVCAGDLDPEVRATTAHVIATRGARTHRTVLDQLRDDPAPHVRKAAAQALGRLGA